MIRLSVPFALLLAASAFGPASAEDATCKKPENALGVSRIVEIDTKTGALFGEYTKFEKEPRFLGAKEVVLTFDDGPLPKFTKPILDALDEYCTKATFFNVGEMVKEYPDVAREVQAQGHTIGTHTWSHPNLGALSLEGAKRQIESTISIEDKVLPNGVAPFFRFPYLSDPKGVREYLASRNIAIFSTDVDSLDYRMRSPDKVVQNVLTGLAKTGGGIILFHDIHEVTAKALPTVLSELKSHGFHVVHLVPKSRVDVVAVAEEPPKAEPRVRSYRHRRHARHH